MVRTGSGIFTTFNKNFYNIQQEFLTRIRSNRVLVQSAGMNEEILQEKHGKTNISTMQIHFAKTCMTMVGIMM